MTKPAQLKTKPAKAKKTPTRVVHVRFAFKDTEALDISLLVELLTQNFGTLTAFDAYSVED